MRGKLRNIHAMGNFGTFYYYFESYYLRLRAIEDT